MTRARSWFDALASGRVPTLAALASEVGGTPKYIACLPPLACLAPAIVEATARGEQPAELTAEALTRADDLPLAWAGQPQHLGFS